jgi:uncharacterized protein YqeY
MGMRLCLGASRAEVNPAPLPGSVWQKRRPGAAPSASGTVPMSYARPVMQEDLCKWICLKRTANHRVRPYFRPGWCVHSENAAGDTMREQLTSELKVAMKAGQKRRVDTIRMINAALKDRDIEARGQGKSVSDDDILALLQKLVKSRQESAEIYEKAGRTDLSTQEREEIAIIQSFLPQPLSAAEVEAAVEAAIAETGAASIKDMGKVVGVLKSKYAGRFDVAKASGMVKAKLGG